MASMTALRFAATDCGSALKSVMMETMLTAMVVRMVVWSLGVTIIAKMEMRQISIVAVCPAQTAVN